MVSLYLGLCYRYILARIQDGLRGLKRFYPNFIPHEIRKCYVTRLDGSKCNRYHKNVEKKHWNQQNNRIGAVYLRDSSRWMINLIDGDHFLGDGGASFLALFLIPSRRSFEVATFEIFSAKVMLLIDSVTCFDSGDRWTITRVLLSPSEFAICYKFVSTEFLLKLSSNIRVSWQFLNGMCFWFCRKASTTLPSSDRDLKP